MGINYAKVWTDIFNDEWFVGLTGLQRSIWLQLIVLCKQRGDTGHVVVASWSALGHELGIDRGTLRRFCTDSSHSEKIITDQSNPKNIRITLPEYEHWQGVTVKERAPIRYDVAGKNRTDLPPKKDTRPNQTRPNQTNLSPNGDSTVSENKQIILYHAEKYKAEYGEEPHIVWGRDAASAKRLLEQHTIEQIRNKIDALFESDDDWIRKNDKTLAKFESVYSMLVSKKPKEVDYSRPPGAR